MLFCWKIYSYFHWLMFWSMTGVASQMISLAAVNITFMHTDKGRGQPYKESNSSYIKKLSCNRS